MSEAQGRQMTFAEYKKLDIAGRLKFWRDLPHGTILASIGFPDPGWDAVVREVCKEALEEIEFLRSVAGAVSRGPSFEDYKRK